MKKFFLSLLLIIAGTFYLFSQDLSRDYITVKNILYREGSDSLTAYMQERCLLDLYYPGDMKDFPVIVWFHGGGLTGGERYFPQLMMNQGVAIVAVGYRLSPGVHSPAWIDDAAAAVAWVFNHISEYGGSTDKIIVSGHSAGGYLTSMIGLDKEWLAHYKIDADDIALLAPFSGHTITHFTVRDERGIKGTRPLIDELAPLWYVRKDAPPLLLITGDRELEMLGRYEENAYLWRMMKENGHTSTMLYELKSFNHGTMVEPASLLLVNYIKSEFNNKE